MKKYTQVSLRIEKEIHDKIKIAAIKENKKVSEYYREMVILGVEAFENGVVLYGSQCSPCSK